MDEVEIQLPSLKQLRSRKYCKIAQHNANGVVHSRAWESTKLCSNSLHSLRLSEDYVDKLRKKKGPKGRRSSRVVGSTPDESYIQPGQRANGLPHQLRGQMNLIFQCPPQTLVNILNDTRTYLPKKRHRVNLVMPNLRLAVDELKSEIFELDPSLKDHLAFRKGWLPCMARLVEVYQLNKDYWSRY